MPLVKKKNGHSPVCEEPLEPEATLHAGRTEPSPSPRKQALGPCKSLNGEKRKSMSPGLRVKTSPDPKQVEEVSELARSSKNTRRRKRPRKLQPSQPGTLGSERPGMLCTLAQLGKMASGSRQPRDRNRSRGAPGNTTQR